MLHIEKDYFNNFRTNRLIKWTHLNAAYQQIKLRTTQLRIYMLLTHTHYQHYKAKITIIFFKIDVFIIKDK